MSAGWFAQGLLLSGRLSAGFLVYAAAGGGLFVLARPAKNEIHRLPQLSHNGISISFPVLIAAISFAAAASICAGLGVMHAPVWFWGAFICWTIFIVFCGITARDDITVSVKRLKEPPWAPPLILLMVSLTFGLFRLTEVPVTVHGDEGMVGVHARMVLEGDIETLFSSSWYSIPQLFFAIPAIVMAVFGDSLFSLRLTSTLLGAAVVLMAYQYCRSVWGWRAALAASMMLACNHWFLFLMHSGVQYIQAAFFGIGALIIWAQVDKSRSVGWCVIAGVWLGLAMQSYQANHVLPVLWIFSQLWLLCWRRISAGWLVLSTLVPLGFMLLTLGPLIVHDYCKISRLDFVQSRVQSVLIWNQDDIELSAPFWRAQFERALLAPVFYLDQSAQFGGDAPMLDRAGAALLVLACIAALLRFYEPPRAVPLLWALAILAAGAALLMDAPFYPRLAGTTPLLFILIAGLFHEIETSLQRLKSRRWLLGIVLSLLVVVSGAFNLNEFFGRYAHQTSPRSVHYPQAQLAYWLQQLPGGAVVYVFEGPHCTAQNGAARFLANHVETKRADSVNQIDEPKPTAIVVDPVQKIVLPEIQDKFWGSRVELHRNRFGDLMFYSVSL